VPAIVKVRASDRMELHPAALAAYEWCSIYPRWVNASVLPESLISELSRETLHGVMREEDDDSSDKKKSPRTFQLFAPLWPVLIWPSNKPPIGTQLISYLEHHITTSEIEKAAWRSVISSLIQSVDPDRLSEIRDTLAAHMPVLLHQEFLGADKLTDRMLASWTGRAHNTLMTQRKQRRRREQKTKASIPSSTSDVISELSKLLSPPHD
jgi:hypothetical protein